MTKPNPYFNAGTNFPVAVVQSFAFISHNPFHGSQLVVRKASARQTPWRKHFC